MMLRFKGFNQLPGEDVLSTQDISGNACRIVWLRDASCYYPGLPAHRQAGLNIQGFSSQISLIHHLFFAHFCVNYVSTPSGQKG